MKRLLKKNGSLIVHLDWHAVHYVKQELDKLFGPGSALPKANAPGFRNEIAWCYLSGGIPGSELPRKHDSLLWYSRGSSWTYNPEYKPYTPGTLQRGLTQVKGPKYKLNPQGTPMVDWWTDISKSLSPTAYERIGYPTQKPEALLDRVVRMFSSPNHVVADFFVGGGTAAAVAQHLGRRWIACDQSRVAVAITSDRLARVVEQMPLQAQTFAVPDFTVEHWGIYEAKRLAETPPEQFRDFVLRAFGAVPDNSQPGIHGHKGAVPVWVGQPDQKSQVTAKDVQDFANAVRKTVRYQQDNLRDGIMLAWAFRPDAVQAAERLRELEVTELNFIRLDLIRIDSPRFREHVHALSTESERADYSTFLTFVQPPKVEVGWRQVSGRMYKFDVSETVVLNANAKIINVQWDFDYRDLFTSTQGFSFVRTAKKEPALQVDYTFPSAGRRRIACKVQDDAGGEGLWVGEIGVQ